MRIYRFTEALEFVLAVSTLSPFKLMCIVVRADRKTEDFAMMEASCAVIRILQTFPQVRLPPGHRVVPLGQEKQELTVFLKSAEGCQVLLD